MTLLIMVTDLSQWVPIIGSVGSLKIDESQWIHQMSNGDIFCTLYLPNPPNFPKLNVYNGFRQFVFGFKTLFGIHRLNQTNRSDWTFYSLSQNDENVRNSAFNRGLTLNFSELLLYSSEVWITECDLV